MLNFRNSKNRKKVDFYNSLENIYDKEHTFYISKETINKLKDNNYIKFDYCYKYIDNLFSSLLFMKKYADMEMSFGVDDGTCDRCLRKDYYLKKSLCEECQKIFSSEIKSYKRSLALLHSNEYSVVAQENTFLDFFK